MRGAPSSSLVSKTTASFRNGPIRCSGIDAMAPLSSSSLRTRGDSLTVLPACRRRAGPAQRRAAVRSCRAPAPGPGRSGAGCGSGRGSCPTARASARGSSGTAWRCPTACRRACTVCESGAFGASSDSGTPACATCCAVSRMLGRDREVGLGAPAAGAASAAASSARAGGRGGKGGRAAAGTGRRGSCSGSPGAARHPGRSVTIAPHQGSSAPAAGAAGTTRGTIFI